MASTGVPGTAWRLVATAVAIPLVVVASASVGNAQAGGSFTSDPEQGTVGTIITIDGTCPTT